MQGSGQPGGKYWVKEFGIKYIGPDGAMREFRNGQGLQVMVNLKLLKNI